MAVSRIHLLSGVVALSLTGLALAQPVDVKSPLSPEESLKHFQLDPLLSIELVAAEPQVVDPVAMRFDEDGRLWVAEMRDYPLGPIKKADGKRTEKDAEPLSQIKILEDKDGDGRFETATVFADKLLFVTGLQPWKGGVIVTLSGKVAYMKDTDGDGKADINETWFTGFSEANSQLRANHPTFALDNHIYIANGLRGGMVVNHLKKLLASGGRKPPDTKAQEAGDSKQETDDAPINISGMDFRFDPLTGDAEAVSGNGQFGLCFDDWGNRFVCSNRNPCQHVVIENRYLKKAPTVAIPTVVQDVAAFAENSRIYPISKFWTTSNLHEGQFTAACGVFIYRGDLLPQQFRGNVFTCDPTGNLIHREIMEPKGATFTSKPAYEGKEFLASPDTWFRPVGMELGPDGALYVVDMYRAVIEHPEWVPDELKKRPDERLGDDRGRIYRIVPKGRRPTIPFVFKKLTAANDEELVAELGNPNAWQRETAQRLLIQTQDETALKPLRESLEDAKHSLKRLHASWVVEKKVGLSLLELAKQFDGPPQLRRQFPVWLERQKMTPTLFSVVSALLLDESDLVRFQVSLSFFPEQFVKKVTSIKLSVFNSIGSGDPWMMQASRLASADHEREIVLFVFDQIGESRIPATPERQVFLLELSRSLVEHGTNDDIQEVMLAGAKLMRKDIWFITAEGMFEGLTKKRVTVQQFVNGSKSQTLADAIKSMRVQAVDLSRSENAVVRYQAIRLLGFLPDSASDLMQIAVGKVDASTREIAIRALARQDSVDPWRELVAAVPTSISGIRHEVLDGVLQRPERISLLLDSLESGSIKPTELDPVQTGRLLKHGDAKIRERAERIFGSATPEDRKKALEDYQSVLTMTGDAKRGQVSFAKNCATCHKIGETGVNVAPDISDSRTKTPSQILADIIQPNRAIDANYVGYNLLLTDGTTAAGILTSETSTSITLKAAGAKVITVARGEIEQLKSTGVSLMPEGLEKTIPKEEMADLIAFIKNWRYLDGRVPVKY